MRCCDALDKYRGDTSRDARRLNELKQQEQRHWHLAERKGALDARMLKYRWLLEDLRVSFFAQ
jgi:ATP-dependent helicase HrpA